MKHKLLAFINLFVIFTMIVPTGVLAVPTSKTETDFKISTIDSIPPNIADIDLRDHGPDPETTLALVGQPVVWINNGTKNHTITEGDPVFSIYLPLTMRGTGSSAAQQVSNTAQQLSHTPIFDSGTLLPGEQYTVTFTTTGAYTYYSASSPGNVVGKILVVEPEEQVSEPVTEGSATTVSTSSGASLEIATGVAVTDTVASISEINASILVDTTGIPVGSTYGMEITNFDDVVSGTLTVTLPYDPSQIPGGISEMQLQAYYFNGLRWISVPSAVDSVQNTIEISTTHLSNWRVQSPCANTFGLTRDQEIAFDKAADYYNRVTNSRDLFDAFVTSDGQSLFGIDFNNAGWLASHTLCDLDNLSPSDIPINKTVNEIVAEMVDFGATLIAIGDDFGEAQEDLETLEKLSLVIASLEVLSYTGGPITGLATSVVKRIIVDTLIFSVLRVALTIEYAGELKDVMNDLDAWLTTASSSGDSQLSSYPANQLTAGSSCNTNGLQASGPMYHYQVPGSGHELSDAYVNLYDKAGKTYLVLGLQNLYPFRAGYFYENFTDNIHLLVEYKDNQGETRATTLRYANSGLSTAIFGFGVCVMGHIELPDIELGSEVKVKYIFEERRKLDRRFVPAGMYSALPNAGTLYYQPGTSPPPPTFVEHIVTDNFYAAQSVYAIDLDDDGDVDILGGGSGAYITWWENDGNENFAEHFIQNNTPNSIYAIDMDNDGDVDILGNFGSIKWWENDGNENFTDHTIDYELYAGYQSVFAIDLDRDGDMDVLSADSGGSAFDIIWWENDGNENFTERVIEEIFFGAHCVYALDMDNDEDIDILGAARYDDDIAWWENDGNENFTKHIIDDNFDEAVSVFAIDMDGDGDIDVLGASRQGSGGFSWWKNDGNENFTKQPFADGYDSARSVYATDLDGDGDVDILGAGTDYLGEGDVTWWQNDGNENFSNYAIVDYNFGADDVFAIDVDGDGDMDILSASSVEKNIVWWEQQP